jgi:dTDP-4-dehydrorhamnose reductase
LASESIAASVPSAIVRTNFFGRSQRAGRSSFSDWIYHGLKRGDSLPVFEDVFFSPLAIPTLCDMLEKVIRRRPVGTFNLGSKNGMSKADFAFYFAATTGLPKDKLLRTSSLESSGNKARRPLDMRMNCDLFEEAMQIKLPNLADELNLIRDFYVEQS